MTGIFTSTEYVDTKAARRERIATAAMQGLTALPNAWEELTHEQLVSLSVKYADLLIAELDKEPAK